MAELTMTMLLTVPVVIMLAVIMTAAFMMIESHGKMLRTVRRDEPAPQPREQTIEELKEEIDRMVDEELMQPTGQPPA